MHHDIKRLMARLSVSLPPGVVFRFARKSSMKSGVISETRTFCTEFLNTVMRVRQWRLVASRNVPALKPFEVLVNGVVDAWRVGRRIASAMAIPFRSRLSEGGRLLACLCG